MYARGMLGNESDYHTEADNTKKSPTLMAMSSNATNLMLSDLRIPAYSQYKVQNPVKGKVPQVTGMGLRDAVATLERHGIVVTKAIGTGFVTRQTPEAGTPIKKGMKATLQLNNN